MAAPSSGHFMNYLQRHLVAIFELFAAPSSGQFLNYLQRHLAVFLNYLQRHLAVIFRTVCSAI
jgi:hypothetical protein